MAADDEAQAKAAAEGASGGGASGGAKKKSAAPKKVCRGCHFMRVVTGHGIVFVTAQGASKMARDALTTQHHYTSFCHIHFNPTHAQKKGNADADLDELMAGLECAPKKKTGKK